MTAIPVFQAMFGRRATYGNSRVHWAGLNLEDSQGARECVIESIDASISVSIRVTLAVISPSIRGRLTPLPLVINVSVRVTPSESAPWAESQRQHRHIAESQDDGFIIAVRVSSQCCCSHHWAWGIHRVGMSIPSLGGLASTAMPCQSSLLRADLELRTPLSVQPQKPL